ncbi:crustacean hyperglycemic hormones-like isoform X1 [Eriocheir sinensis]|uniref:crustacean hyperglycemic hormones-like isoform X1 n=1 Tax=Eriocheir sinensis TaxID=95602 RepID=UPI0021CA5BA9|nr:crustacean hyperglycemic hormones-like isoform X1 [Eriocheir sinensis]
MVAYRMTSTVALVVVVALGASILILPHAHARSAEGFGRMERLLGQLRGGADSSAALGELRVAGEGPAGHPLDKRQAYDRSCKGIYDRSLFSKLEHVCDDCFNLYRSSHVASGCRENCYSNLVFRQCMDDLLLMDMFDEYAKAIRVVGRKK